jgi:hypothetical protein
MIGKRWLIPLSALAVALGGAMVHGRPPDNADPALSPWFQGLTDPVGGGSCCSQADCRPVEYRTAGDHFEVLIGKQYGEDVEPHWEPVEPERVLRKTDNPTGRAIACWLPYTTPKVLCFVRPAET